MPDLKISAGADPVTLVGTDKVPVARSASTTAYAATMAEVSTWTNSGLPYSAASPAMDSIAAPGTVATVSRGDHVHPSDTSRAPLVSPALSGTPTAPTATPATDSSTKLATTAFVQSALTATVAATFASTNYIDNSGFLVNQRSYTSGAALAAGVYGFDRWKAGAGGATLTFTASPASTVVTITAGSLQQIVEGAALLTGNYTLSWTGTAQGRIGAGAYAASPATAAATAGTNLTVEFNTGTLSRVKLEVGSAATVWQPFPVQIELGKCQRFYQAGNAQILGSSYIAGGYVQNTLTLPVVMRVNPTVTSSFPGATNTTTATVGVLGAGALTANATATAIGLLSAIGTYTASADL